MTLPRKKSRPIEVNGRLYRWMIKSTVDQDVVRLTVQDQKTGELRQRRIQGWRGDSPTVTPRDVKEFILYRFEQPSA